jgi:cytochrome c oxidase subunit 3
VREKKVSAPSVSHYFIPQPSYWPITGSIALMSLALGFVTLLHGSATVAWSLIGLGFAILAYMLVGWFGTVARESEAGHYNDQVDRSFRWSMSWFIFSEVMFFGAFFGALFYARQISVPWLGDIDNKLLWPNFNPSWPTNGPLPLDPQAIEKVSAWGIPALNTLILLSSGWTVTMAHWALKKNNRGALNLWLFLTSALGILFLGLQAYEYVHAYSEGLTLKQGVFGATFYMLTGFHGFHVTIGTIMLIVILIRCLAGHFQPEQHFGFEAVSWYWHFVDVVWLLLFVLVYWL